MLSLNHKEMFYCAAVRTKKCSRPDRCKVASALGSRLLRHCYIAIQTPYQTTLLTTTPANSPALRADRPLRAVPSGRPSGTCPAHCPCGAAGSTSRPRPRPCGAEAPPTPTPTGRRYYSKERNHQTHESNF